MEFIDYAVTLENERTTIFRAPADVPMLDAALSAQAYYEELGVPLKQFMLLGNAPQEGN